MANVIVGSQAPGSDARDKKAAGSRSKNLIGLTFGRQRVVSFAGIGRRGYANWLCECECGIMAIRCSSDLLRGASGSCGCLSREKSALRMRALGKKRQIFSDAECVAIADAYMANARESLESLAAAHGVDAGTISAALARAGVKKRSASEAHRIWDRNEAAFDLPASDERAAYFIGLMLADGSIDDRRGALSLALSGEDGEMVEHFAAFLRWTGAVATRRRHGCQPQTRVDIRSRRLVEALARWGVGPRKSFTATPAKELSENRDFWRGCVDGDGCLCLHDHGPRLGLTGSLDTVKAFAFYVRTKTDTAAEIRPNGSVWMFEVGGRHAAVIARLLYDNCMIALPRKAAVARRAANYSPMKQSRSWGHVTAERLLEAYGRLGSWKEVGRELGMPGPDNVHRIRRRLGLMSPPRIKVQGSDS